MADIGKNLKNIWMKSMEAIGNTASSIASSTKYKLDEMSMTNKRNEIMNDFGARAYALWQKGERFPEELETQLRELARLDETLNDMRAERYASIKAAMTEMSPEGEAAPEGEKTEAAPGAEEEIPAGAAEAVPETPDEAAPGAPKEEDASFPAETAETAGQTSAENEAPLPVDAPGKAEDAPEGGEVPVIEVEGPEKHEKTDRGLSSDIDDLFEKKPTPEEAAEKVNGALDSIGSHLVGFSEKIGKGIGDLADSLMGRDDEE